MNKCFKALLLLVLPAVMCGACTGRLLAPKAPPTPIRGKYAVIVTAGPKDTLDSLARTYLKDARRAWQIAAFNNINTLQPGEQVIIPLRPITLGGLHTSGYQTVPVLVYDHITGKSPKKEKTATTSFEQQLRHLKSKGFSTLSLDEFHGFRTLKSQLPPLSILICLDSTDRWVYTTAYPLLKHYQMQAAVFIATDKVGGKNKLTWDQLAQLARAGYSIGSRGTTGRYLAHAKAGEEAEDYLSRLEAEIRDSRRIIGSRIKRPCRDFAYRYNVISDVLIALLKKHGYRSAYINGDGSNPFFVDDYKIQRRWTSSQWSIKRFQSNLATFHPMELR